MKILVTGGAGFIGSHLVERLLADDHDVTLLDNFSTGERTNLDTYGDSRRPVIVEGSILDVQLVTDLVLDSEYVFHLAAAVGVFNIVNDPINSLITNIQGTENVLKAALHQLTPVFVTSSSEVYGKNTSDSLSEGDDRILGSPLTLRWSYSEAKAIDESLAYAYWLEKNLPTRIVRFFNTVGPRQSGRYGMVIPRLIEQALSNYPISIYGTGNQTRCFAHVLDVIDAVMSLAFHKDAIGRVINVGNNFEISMNDLAKKIISQTGSESQIQYVSYEEAYGTGFEDMERRVPNLSLINSLTGWEPKRDLTQIIADMITEMRD